MLNHQHLPTNHVNMLRYWDNHIFLMGSWLGDPPESFISQPSLGVQCPGHIALSPVSRTNPGFAQEMAGKKGRKKRWI